MGYIPPHLYIITGDKRFEASYRKEERFNIWGIAISGGLSFLAIIGALIYCLILIGGN